MASSLLVTAALFASCGKSDEDAPDDLDARGEVPGRVIVVNIPDRASALGDRAFGGPLQIDLGDTVRWVNQDSVAHTVTSTSGVFDSGPILPGLSFSYRFWKSGEYPYFDGMQGLRGAVKVTGTDVGGRPPHTPHPEPGDNPDPQPQPQPQPTSQPGEGGDSNSGCSWNPPSWWPWPCRS